jgi:hypothetical protein
MLKIFLSDLWNLPEAAVPAAATAAQSPGLKFITISLQASFRQKITHVFSSTKSTQQF